MVILLLYVIDFHSFYEKFVISRSVSVIVIKQRKGHNVAIKKVVRY